MKIIMEVSQDNNRCWHWLINDLINQLGSAYSGAPRTTCCSDKGGSCKGFATKLDAEKAGRAYAEAHKIK